MGVENFWRKRFAKRIATAIVDFNKSAVKNGTEFLSRTSHAELISRVVPFKDKHKHPATLVSKLFVFFINSELDELESLLNSALDMLAPEGRLSIISFHSLEDRMVKHL